MIICRLDICVALKRPQDILMASFETDSRLASSLSTEEIYNVHSLSILDHIIDL